MTVLPVISASTHIAMKLWNGMGLQIEDFLIVIGLVSKPTKDPR